MKRVPPETAIIGSNLRRLREKACLSQREAAQALGVSFQQVQKYETGSNRLPAEKLYLLKHLYDAPYSQFYAGFEKFVAPRYRA